MSKIANIMTIATTASMVAVPAAMASTITVDDFSVSQLVADEPGTGVNESVVTGDMIGGTRFMKVSNNTGATGGTTLNSEGGLLTFNNNSGTDGFGYVVYDGTTDRDDASDTSIGVGVNILGLNEDILLRSVSETFFSFDLSEFDNDIGSTALFSAFAWDREGKFAEFNEIVGGGFDVSARLFLSEFTGDAIDWTQVGALAFKIDSREGVFNETPYGELNFDATVGPTTISAIPLPASVLLLLSGLGGFAGISVASRRRKKA